MRLLGVMVLGAALLAVVTVAAVYWHVAADLPAASELRDVRLQEPIRVYSRDGLLMAEFGEQRRTPRTVEDVPTAMIEALLAAEDERFFEHPGVDWQGLVRAVAHLVRTGEKGPGGSTITMQVARNFFLGREKTYTRKLNEIVLALRIERELTKEEILGLYLNKIFLGHRAYGVAAAAEVYYGRPLEALDVAEVAMIAGLPKAPSLFNPIVAPDRALARRNYVLGRMRDLGFIDSEEYHTGVAAPNLARVHAPIVEVSAHYVAEMARVFLEQLLGEDAYTSGYRVHTTIDSRHQEAANSALRNRLIDYDRRHGFRGPELQLELTPDVDAELMLADVPIVGGLPPALVLSVEERALRAHVKGVGEVEVPWSGIEWAQPYVDENRRGSAPRRAADVVAPGDVIRVQSEGDAWRLAQVPAVEGALVSVAPDDGAIVALVGGFDFFRSKFNRGVQAERQPGSSFKPFVYTAALARGFTPASIINDAPVIFDDPSLEGAWRPENYSGQFFGPTRLREALTNSRNLVSIRLLQAVGVEYTAEYLQRFGLPRRAVPPNLSMALGSGVTTPLEVAIAYAIIANGGYRVEPYFVQRVTDADGQVIFEADPLVVCPECPSPTEPAATERPTLLASGRRGEGVAQIDEESGPASRPSPRVIAAQDAWIMYSMLRDVITEGTGRRARELGRRDIAGKTGTTNEQKDAWFAGFTPKLSAAVWVGFDQVRPLGRQETGSRAALPVWMDYMEVALADLPDELPLQPDGVVTVRIDPQTGEVASASHPSAVFELFRSEFAPTRIVGGGGSERSGRAGAEGLTRELF